MPEKVFLDDVRPAPDGTWFVARHPATALAALQQGDVHTLSLDHDLGHQLTGHDVIKQALMLGHQPPQYVQVHTQNPVGARAIQHTLLDAGYKQLGPRSYEFQPDDPDEEIQPDGSHGETNKQPEAETTYTPSSAHVRKPRE